MKIMSENYWNCDKQHIVLSIATTFTPNQVQSVVLRYLVVESTFPYIYIVYLRQSFNPSRQIGSSFAIGDKYIVTPVSVSKDDDYLMHVINGFDIYDVFTKVE